MPSSPIGFSEYLPGLLLVAGLLLLTFIMFFNLHTRLRNRPSISDAPAKQSQPEPVSSAPPDASSTQTDSAGVQPRHDLEPATIEAQEICRKLVAELQTRSATLATLIHQADERIAALEHAIDQVVGVSISPTHSPQVAFINPEHLNGRTVHGPLSDHIVNGEPSPSNHHRLPVMHLMTPPAASTTAPEVVVRAKPPHDALQQPHRHHHSTMSPVEMLDPLTASVYELADRGRSSLEIAQSLDEQVGKVELILALRPERTQSPTMML